MLSTILSSLGFVISIAMVQSGGPPADIVKGGPPADIVKGGPNTDIGKGGTPPSVGSGFGYNDDLCWKYCQSGLAYVGAALTAFPVENGCPTGNSLGQVPIPVPGETCYVSCDIRMDNIGMQLFSMPSTCGPDCFQVTESTISKMFQHMTKDRCPFVPAFNTIKANNKIPVISSTGVGSYTVCRAELEDVGTFLFGMPVLNSQCLPPMGLLISEDVGYTPTHSQYKVNLASIRPQAVQKGGSSSGLSALYSVSAVLRLVALAVVASIFVHRKYSPGHISREGYNNLFDETRIKHRKPPTRKNYGTNTMTADSSSFGI